MLEKWNTGEFDEKKEWEQYGKLESIWKEYEKVTKIMLVRNTGIISIGQFGINLWVLTISVRLNAFDG